MDFFIFLFSFVGVVCQAHCDVPWPNNFGRPIFFDAIIKRERKGEREREREKGEGGERERGGGGGQRDRNNQSEKEK